MTQGSIPRHLADLLLHACEECGHSAESLLAAAKIDSEDWAAGADLTPYQFGRMHQRAMWLMGDESFGLLGDGVPNGSFRLLCLCVLACATLEQGLERAAEFLDVAIGYRFKPVVHTEMGTACVAMHPVRRVAGRVSSQGELAQTPHTLLIWVNLISWLLGSPLPLRRVLLRQACKHRARHRAFFDCEIAYGCEQDGFDFAAEALSWPIVRNEMELERFLEDAMPVLLSPRRATTGWRNKVLAVLADGGFARLPTSGELSARLHVSRATLRRRLAEEGTSFQELKDQHRYAAALRYLASTDLPLKSIANRCGFGSPADFNRAFRRWSGQTPGQYRLRLQPDA